MLLDESVRRKLHQRTFWHLVTLDPDGMPHVRPVWVDESEGLVLVNTGAGWRKERNARADPRVALSMVEFANPYERVEIRGRVVGFVEGASAKDQLDRLAGRYLGLDSYPWMKPGERRIIMQIEPTQVVHHIDTDDPTKLPTA